MLNEILTNLRKTNPLVHCITNFVTVNDCANILLAAGASPTMADTTEEMEEIVSLANALVVNIGTINTAILPSMLAAAKQAKKLSRPAVLDPVGAGSSKIRTETARDLLETGAFTAVRGNISEIRALAGVQFTSHGVDASAGDAVTMENLPECLSFAKAFSEKYQVITAISGALDLLVAPDGQAVLIRNGHPMMPKVTGTGCMSSVLCGAFAAASSVRYFDGITAAVTAMGVCGEIAYARLLSGEGNATYRTKIIDAMYNLDGETLTRMARIEKL